MEELTLPSQADHGIPQYQYNKHCRFVVSCSLLHALMLPNSVGARSQQEHGRGGIR